MTYAMKPLGCEPARLDGLSAKLIDSHYRNNYGGAVKRLDAIRAELGALDWAQAPGFKVAALKREELIAANSAFLHELYFDCLGAGPALKAGGLSVAFARDFGSFDAWRAQFSALGRALGGGSGWALCSWSTREHRLLVHWGADHMHMPAGATPILALDMYEHSYHMDFGADASAYVDAYMRNIDWEKASARYATALEHATVDLALPNEALLADRDRCHLIDVRRAPAYESAKEIIAGATWRDPQQVENWADALPRTGPVIVYCVYGHDVSQSTAAILSAKGIDARFLAGGIHDWKAAGRPLESK